MDSLNTNQIQRGAIAAAVLLVVALLTTFSYSRYVGNPLEAGMSHRSRSRQSYFQETERKGILSAADYTRLAEGSDSIQQRQQMSDADLDAWAAVLQKGPLRDTPSNRMGFDTIVLGLGIGRKRLTPSQQEKMYDTVLPFVSDAAYAKAMDLTDKTDSSDLTSPQGLRMGSEEIAAMLLAETRDPRGLSVLNDLARNSPYPHLRRTAQKEHDKLAAALAATAQPMGGKQ